MLVDVRIVRLVRPYHFPNMGNEPIFWDAILHQDFSGLLADLWVPFIVEILEVEGVCVSGHGERC